MANTINHSDILPVDRHAPVSWVFASDSVRLGTTVSSSDINKLAVVGTGSSSVLYIAVASGVGASSWQAVGSASSGGSGLTPAQVQAIIDGQKGVTGGLAAYDATQASIALKANSSDVTSTVNSAITAQKGVVNGLAPLGSDGKVPSVNLPTPTASYTDAQALVQANSAIAAVKGLANGLAPLGSDSLVPTANLPIYAANILTSTQVGSLTAGIARHSSIVIAAYDTIGKAGADIICTASNARAQIQAAITSMRGRPGRIFLMAGTYDLDDELIVDTSWLDIEGESHGFWGKYAVTTANFANFPRSTPGTPGGTLLKQNTAGKGVFRVGTNYFDSDSRHKSIGWKKLSMYGPSGTGIAIYDNVMSDICRIASCNVQGFAAGFDVKWDNPLIFDNNIQDTGGNGAVSATAPGGIRVRGVRGSIYGNCVFQVGGVGIWCGSYGASVMNNIVGGTNDHNIMVTSGKVKVIGNDVCSPGSKGLTRDCIVVANYPEAGAATANFLSAQPAAGCIIANNTCSMVMEDNAAFPQNAAGSCITIGKDGGTIGSNCDYTVVQGNTCSSSIASIAAGIYAIDVRNASNNCAVQGNTIRGAWNGGGAAKISAGTGANNAVIGNAGTT